MSVLFSAVIKLIKKRIEFSLELVHYNQIHTPLNFQNKFSLLLQLLSDSAHPMYEAHGTMQAVWYYAGSLCLLVVRQGTCGV